MERILTSIIIGVCILLGTISSQAKSYKIVEHISSEHSSHKNAHSHHHHVHTHHKHQKSEKKNSKSHDRRHAAELSFITIHLALPAYNGFVTEALLSLPAVTGFYSLNVLNQLSFSPPVFRPPIA